MNEGDKIVEKMRTDVTILNLKLELESARLELDVYRTAFEAVSNLAPLLVVKPREAGESIVAVIEAVETMRKELDNGQE